MIPRSVRAKILTTARTRHNSPTNEWTTAIVKPPFKVHRSSDPDAFTACQARRLSACLDFDALPYLLSVVLHVNSKGLTQAAGAACQFLYLACLPPLAHPIKPFSRFDGTDQDSTRPFAIRGEIQAIVHSINEIHVHMAEGVLHYH